MSVYKDTLINSTYLYDRQGIFVIISKMIQNSLLFSSGIADRKMCSPLCLKTNEFRSHRPHFAGVSFHR
jgi:hypothetical protein